MNKLDHENCFGRPSGAWILLAVAYSISRFGIRSIGTIMFMSFFAICFTGRRWQ